MWELNTLPVPTVALIQGGCFGGGTGIAASCDVVVAADNAMFAIAETRWGMAATIIFPQLADAIGVRHLRRYAQTGERFDAMEARRIGLVHEVVPAEDLLDAAVRMARLIAANNAFGVWQTKSGLNAALDAPSLRHAKELENRIQILTGFTKNPEEAAKAHREKRDPVWDPL